MTWDDLKVLTVEEVAESLEPGTTLQFNLHGGGPDSFGVVIFARGNLATLLEEFMVKLTDQRGIRIAGLSNAPKN